MTNAVTQSPGKITRATLIAKHTLAPALTALAEAAEFCRRTDAGPPLKRTAPSAPGLAIAGRLWRVKISAVKPTS
jgi:hypothetical protein